MPLNRPGNGHEPIDELGGVLFEMSPEGANEPVGCRVSSQALRENAQSGEKPLETFSRLRTVIEGIASQHFDDGKVGVITTDSVRIWITAIDIRSWFHDQPE